MGIQVEFNPDLALRRFGTPDRNRDECLPKRLEPGIYSFLKSGQRVYWFGGEIPLLETKGDQQLSRPLASVIIIESSHFRNYADNEHGEVWTRGTYRIVDVYDPNDSTVHFDGLAKIASGGSS